MTSLNVVRVEHLRLVTEKYDEPIIVTDDGETMTYLIVPLNNEPIKHDKKPLRSVSVDFDDGSYTLDYGKKGD